MQLSCKNVKIFCYRPDAPLCRERGADRERERESRGRAKRRCRGPQSARLIFFIVAAARTRSLPGSGRKLQDHSRVSRVALSFSSPSHAAQIQFHEIIQRTIMMKHLLSKRDNFAEYGTQLFIRRDIRGKVAKQRYDPLSPETSDIPLSR